MAIAALGEGVEWPARVVHALSLLREEEGALAREILEEALDGWAEELGFEPLSPGGSTPGATAPNATLSGEEDAWSLDVAEGLEMVAPPNVESLEDPIAHDEFERAFAEAEAQTDQMHDVNRVAERVLLDEPAGLAELSGEVLGPVAPAVPIDVDPFDVSGDELALETGSVEEVLAVDAAVADDPIWPGVVVGDRQPAGPPPPAQAFAAREDSFEAGAGEAGDRPGRERVLTTLEQWLENLETRRQGRRGRAR